MKIKKAGAGDFWFSGRALAWHVQGPELGPQHQEKKKKKNKGRKFVYSTYEK
jgi:hypothetical protein